MADRDKGRERGGGIQLKNETKCGTKASSLHFRIIIIVIVHKELKWPKHDFYLNLVRCDASVSRIVHLMNKVHWISSYLFASRHCNASTSMRTRTLGALYYFLLFYDLHTIWIIIIVYFILCTATCIWIMMIIRPFDFCSNFKRCFQIAAKIARK